MALRIERDRIVKVSELHNDTSKWVEAAQEGPLFIMRYGSPGKSGDINPNSKAQCTRMQYASHDLKLLSQLAA